MRLSVLIITYNHEKYLAQALDSALMQEVDFDYEIVVGEDNSTDKTAEILEGYRLRFPDRIRVVSAESNVGMHQNFIRTYRACDGDYIAMLEGDDFWTSANKLQMQVDFLERNPDYAICFHGVEIFDEASGKIIDSVRASDVDTTFTLDDLICENIVPTCSAVFRNKLIEDFPLWLFGLKQMDWPIHVLNAHHGKLMYLHHSAAVYRVHSAGVWNQNSEEIRLKEIIKAFDALIANFDDRFTQKLQHAQGKYRRMLLKNYVEAGNLEAAAALMLVIAESYDPEDIEQLKSLAIKMKYNRLYLLGKKLRCAVFAVKKRLVRQFRTCFSCCRIASLALVW